MIRDKVYLQDCPHYFDNLGFIHDIEINSPFEFDPQSIEFMLKDGRTVNLFINNNPWRATDGDMVYQYCVLCKEMKFENISFFGSKEDFQEVENRIRSGSDENLFFCKKISCLAEKWFDCSDNIASNKLNAIFTLSNVSTLSEIIAKEEIPQR